MALKDGQFTISGHTFTAKTFKPSFESLQSSDSGRTDDGVMHIVWVLRKIRKLEITMPPMTTSEVSSLLSLVQGQQYNITYHDALTNADKTINVYTTKSSADCYSGIIRNGLYENVSFNAIEIGGE